MFPYFRNILYNGISNTLYDDHIWCFKPDWELQFPKFCKKDPVFVHSFGEIIFEVQFLFWDRDENIYNQGFIA